MVFNKNWFPQTQLTEILNKKQPQLKLFFQTVSNYHRVAFLSNQHLLLPAFTRIQTLCEKDMKGENCFCFFNVVLQVKRAMKMHSMET